MEIFVCVDMDAEQRSWLEQEASPDQVHFLTESEIGDAPDPRFSRCEVAFGSVPPAWFESTRTLRWLQLDSTGINEYLHVDVSATGLTITNCCNFFTEPVAESCLAGILALHRGIDRLVRLQERREWVGHPLRKSLRTLAGSQVVLFGYGAINQRMVDLLSPFGCEKTVFRSKWSAEKLDEAVSEADIICCVAPETSATRLVFDRRRIALLHSDAIFVNFGRGSLVDEAALAEALSSNRISGAVIDVTETEPLPADHPFWRLPNVILTQHSGGGSDWEIDGKIKGFLGNLERYRFGEKLRCPVDLERGY